MAKVQSSPLTDTSDIADRVLLKSDLDRTYAELRDSAIGPEYGLFGPDSMMWKSLAPLPVLPLMLIQAGLLEGPVPKIWFGTENSITRAGDLASRYARSFDAFHDWFTGDIDTALKTGRRIHSYHSRITGYAPQSLGDVVDGQKYAATEQDLMILTWGTQIVPIKQFYEIFVRTMTPAEAEAYYDDCKRFAKIFGIDEASLPPTYPDFVTYWEGALNSGEMQLPPTGHERFAPLLDQSEMRFVAKWLARWVICVQFNLLPDNIRRMYEPITPLAKRRPILTKTTTTGVKYLWRALPTGIRISPRVRAAHRRIGAIGEPDRIERWFITNLPHPFGEKLPTLNTPKSAAADPKHSGAFSIPPR